MEELSQGLDRLMEAKRLQVLRRSFEQIRDARPSAGSIIKDTLRKIAGRSDSGSHVIQQEEGIVKSIIELSAALEPILSGDDNESKESVKIALMSTLEQGVRLQNTIGYNSLTSSIAQLSHSSQGGNSQQQALDVSVSSSSVTNTAMVSNMSFRDRWNSSTRVRQNSQTSGLSHSPSKGSLSLGVSLSQSRASIMYSQAEKVLRDHNEKLTQQIESLDSQVALVTAERNKLRAKTAATQQQAAREVEAAKAAAAAAQAQKDEAAAAAEALRQKNLALAEELSEFESIVVSDRTKYASILKAREDARKHAKQQLKRAEIAEKNFVNLSPKKEKAEAEARSAKKKLQRTEDEYAKLKDRLEESRRKEAAKDLDIKRLEMTTRQLNKQLMQVSTEFQGQKRKSEWIKQEIMSDMQNTSGTLSSMEQRLHGLIVENERLTTLVNEQQQQQQQQQEKKLKEELQMQMQVKSIELQRQQGRELLGASTSKPTLALEAPRRESVTQPQTRQSEQQMNKPPLNVELAAPGCSSVSGRAEATTATATATATVATTLKAASSSQSRTRRDDPELVDENADTFSFSSHAVKKSYATASVASDPVVGASGPGSSAGVSSNLSVASARSEVSSMKETLEGAKIELRNARVEHLRGGGAGSVGNGAARGGVLGGSSGASVSSVGSGNTVVSQRSVQLDNRAQRADIKSVVSVAASAVGSVVRSEDERSVVSGKSKGSRAAIVVSTTVNSKQATSSAATPTQDVSPRSAANSELGEKDASSSASSSAHPCDLKIPERRLQIAEARAAALQSMLESMPPSLAIAQAERRVVEARLEKTVVACESRVGLISSAAEREIALLHQEIFREGERKEILSAQLQQHASVIQDLTSHVASLQHENSTARREMLEAASASRLNQVQPRPPAYLYDGITGSDARTGAGGAIASFTTHDELQLPIAPWDPVAAPGQQRVSNLFSAQPAPTNVGLPLVFYPSVPGSGPSLPISPLRRPGPSNAGAPMAVRARQHTTGSSGRNISQAGEPVNIGMGVGLNVPTGLDHSQLSLQQSFEAYFGNINNNQRTSVSTEGDTSWSGGAFHNRLGLSFPPAQLPEYQLTRGQTLVHTLAPSTSSTAFAGAGEGMAILSSTKGVELSAEVQTSRVLLQNLQAMMALHNLGPLAGSARHQ